MKITLSAEEVQKAEVATRFDGSVLVSSYGLDFLVPSRRLGEKAGFAVANAKEKKTGVVLDIKPREGEVLVEYPSLSSSEVLTYILEAIRVRGYETPKSTCLNQLYCTNTGERTGEVLSLEKKRGGTLYLEWGKYNEIFLRRTVPKTWSAITKANIDEALEFLLGEEVQK